MMTSIKSCQILHQKNHSNHQVHKFAKSPYQFKGTFSQPFLLAKVDIVLRIHVVQLGMDPAFDPVQNTVEERYAIAEI